MATLYAFTRLTYAHVYGTESAYISFQRDIDAYMSGQVFAFVTGNNGSGVHT